MRSRLAATLALALVAGLVAAPPRARAGGEGVIKVKSELLKKSKISIAQAIDAALKAAPGDAVSANLTSDDEGQPTFRVTIIKGDTASNVFVNAIDAKAKVHDTWKDDEEKPRNE